jgi:hypothetical protein
MRRFLLFVGSNYYPKGGWNDYRGWFDSIDAAVAEVPTDRRLYEPGGGWYHVVDIQNGETVANGDVDDDGVVTPDPIIG